MAFLELLRLTGARRDLRRPGAATTVTETATRWGFFHFGEFAAAYRRQFGELPSDTLRRAGASETRGGPARRHSGRDPITIRARMAMPR